MSTAERLLFKNTFWTGLVIGGLYAGLSGGMGANLAWYDWLWALPLGLLFVAPIAALFAWLRVLYVRRHPGELQVNRLDWKETLVVIAILAAPFFVLFGLALI